MTFGSRLKELRKQFGFTQEQVAEKVGVQRAVYSHWENGVAHPSNDLMLKCADLFNVTVDYLLGRKGAKKEFSARKKVILLPGKIHADVSLASFSNEFAEWLQSKGWNYEGELEVSFEE